MLAAMEGGLPNCTRANIEKHLPLEKDYKIFESKEDTVTVKQFLAHKMKCINGLLHLV
jgi:hypothetical protein